MLHNHPSGDSQPSVNDIAVTQRLEDTGIIVGIRVVDHVIIGHENCYSICEDRYISENNNTNTELEKENKNRWKLKIGEKTINVPGWVVAAGIATIGTIIADICKVRIANHK